MARRAARTTARTSRRSRKSTFTIPGMKDVEGRVVVAEGEYTCKVAEVTQEEGQEHPYLKWVFEVVDDKEFEGAKLFTNTSLSPAALWNLRTLLEALGIDCEDEDFELDPDDAIDREIVLMVEHETYEGKKQARVVDYAPADSGGKPSQRGRDEKPSRKGRDEKPARGRAKEPESDTISQDDINGMSQDELEDVIKDFDLDVDLSKHKTLRKMRAAVIDAAEEAKVLED